MLIKTLPQRLCCQGKVQSRVISKNPSYCKE